MSQTTHPDIAPWNTVRTLLIAIAQQVRKRSERARKLREQAASATNGRHKNNLTIAANDQQKHADTLSFILHRQQDECVILFGNHNIDHIASQEMMSHAAFTESRESEHILVQLHRTK